MKREYETINLNRITNDDVAQWNFEIRKYIEEHENEQPLRGISDDIRYTLIQISGFLLERATRLKDEIFTDLTIILDGKGVFVETENCLKSSKRIQEKIYKKSEEENVDFMTVGLDIGDVLRYTIVFDEETYVENVNNYLTELEQTGYEVIRFSNCWGKKYYQGINVKVRGPEGIIFEIQFHTKQNYRIKEVFSRAPYLITRSIDSPLDLRVKAYYLRAYYQKMVRIPKYAINYQYQSKKGKTL